MKRYAVVVRRQHRLDSAVADLESILGATAGVRVIGVHGSRAQIEATEEAVEQLRTQFSNELLIEELIERHT